jgi:hypothetical protein
LQHQERIGDVAELLSIVMARIGKSTPETTPAELHMARSDATLSALADSIAPDALCHGVLFGRYCGQPISH